MKRLFFCWATVLVAGCASGGGERAATRADALTQAKSEGMRRMAEGDTAAALAVLGPLARDASADPQVFVLLGRAYAGLGRTPEAIGSYEQAMRLRYESAVAHVELGSLLMRTGRTGRAQTELDLALSFAPGDALVHFNYGVAMNELGRRETALKHWQTARRLEPSDPRYAEAVGIGLTASDPASAVRAFAAAESLGASGAAFHNNWGLAWLAADRPDLAAGRFDRAVKERPTVEPYRFNRVAAWMRLGKFPQAIEGWEAMSTRFGERWSYRVYHARSLVEAGRFKEAAALLVAVVSRADSVVRAGGVPRADRTPPTLDEAYDILALAARGSGDGEAALGYARRATELAPDVVDRLINYGVILAERGMIARARAQWKRVLELDPQNAVARQNLSSVEP